MHETMATAQWRHRAFYFPDNPPTFHSFFEIL
jgi:hypothetical protein